MRSTLLDGVRVDEEARLSLARNLRRKREEDLRAAESFARLERVRHHLAEGCGTLAELGERIGYSASETRMLARAGGAVRLYPPLRTMLLRGRLTLEGVAVLERVLRDHRVRGAQPRASWLYWAKTESAGSLRLRVKRRLEEIRAGGRVHDVTVHLSDRGMDDLDRARDLLSGRARRDVSESEAVETLADYWLVREDPLRVAPGTRRVGDTAANRSRHVPEEVKRKVRERAQGKCEKPFCGRTRGLEFAHVVSHEEGGGREAGDLVLVCHADHVAMDSGWCHVVMLGDWPLFEQGPPPRPVRRRGPGERPPPRVSSTPHLKPNPWSALVRRWTWTRPPPCAVPGAG